MKTLKDKKIEKLEELVALLRPHYDEYLNGDRTTHAIKKLEYEINEIDRALSEQPDTAPTVRDELINLLKIAKCPDCDGSGVIVKEVLKTGTKWVDDGHGNPLPEPYPIQDYEQFPCQWCYERERLISSTANQTKE